MDKAQAGPVLYFFSSRGLIKNFHHLNKHLKLKMRKVFKNLQGGGNMFYKKIKIFGTCPLPPLEGKFRLKKRYTPRLVFFLIFASNPRINCRMRL